MVLLRKLPWNFLGSWTRQCAHPCRMIHTDFVYMKRRKTAEERKAQRIIEYSPKKSNKIVLDGTVDVWRNMTVAELANSAEKSLEHIQEVMLYVPGVDDLDSVTRLHDMKVIKNIVEKCGMKMKIVAPPSSAEVIVKDKDVFPRPPAAPEDMETRHPIVTVMGHVDHGKTTLLDTLRGASVAAGEAGGITQHIGAFTVDLESGEKVTFLDTPGHAAFSAMRARGANCTDIIVLVVAGEDGVMQQTREVVSLAQEAKVPMIIAINKIDKPEANVERTKQGLMQLGLGLEGHGGDIQVVPISALKGTNLTELTETISAQATMMGIKADFKGFVEGIVIESRVDKYRGKLSTTIVTRGTLRKGAILVSGVAFAKVRGLIDHTGKPLESATPGTPVEILGWRELPLAGEQVLEVENEQKANSVIRFRKGKEMSDKIENDREAILKKELEHLEKYRAERDARRKKGFFKSRPDGPRQKEIQDDPTPRVNMILKGDVHGSVEAILNVLDTYDDFENCRLNIVHYGVGNVSEGDVELAKTFNAIIYAFSVDSSVAVKSRASVRDFNVIYHLINDLKEEISSKLPVLQVEEIVGEANILQIFKITEGRKEVTVLGCRCTKGVLRKKFQYKILRQNEIIYTGGLDSMRHLKNEVDSIKTDTECGLKPKDLACEVKPGDVIQCFTLNDKTQTTSWDPGF
ncbi:translation initiation factor IF-2, mitochondrial [Phlebotomus argentipes]|uniref:translation initiation factor IF-2, mitochondrial n=1 Tax=Phlebotomus argentipes TaxID=94469 RepID=UPI002892C2D5|nr:translation initiation factor IF-2, mitochondrial [Phlebotomus argentipes]XP_059610692.1 translation initiation factor IF-2, mitochondrial [Phlebotomus argentipes]